jgi:hypothetical protein
MKKILLILISFYTFSFSDCAVGTFPHYTVNTVYGSQASNTEADCNYRVNLAGYTNTVCYNNGYKWYWKSFTKSNPTCEATPQSPYFPQGDDFCTIVNDVLTCEPRCNELYEEGGVAYSCNPNTNESTPIENSSGLIPDPDNDGYYIPKCDEGYEAGEIGHIDSGPGGNGGSWTEAGCSLIETPPTDNGNNGGDTGISNPLDNTSAVDNGDGTTTVTYPDGSTQTFNTGTNTNPISSTPPTNGTGGGSGGGSGGSNGSGGDIPPSEDNPDTSEGAGDDNDITPVDVATACNDPFLTLEQKMLCELNQGMKNQNSEGNPENSLNNLLKDLVANNQKDNTAINKNIKDLKTNTTITNARLTAVNARLGSLKTINQQLVVAQNQTNDEVEKSNGFLSDLVDKFTAPADNGKAQVDSLDSIIDDDTNFTEEIEATSGLKTTVTDKFNSYSDSLKNELLALFNSFFNINTSSLTALGVPYDFSLSGKRFQGTFLNEQSLIDMSLDKLSNIIIFAFSLLGFFHAFNLVVSSSSTTSKDK